VDILLKSAEPEAEGVWACAAADRAPAIAIKRNKTRNRLSARAILCSPMKVKRNPSDRKHSYYHAVLGQLGARAADWCASGNAAKVIDHPCGPWQHQ
jgi:hypothetical protein